MSRSSEAGRREASCEAGCGWASLIGRRTTRSEPGVALRHLRNQAHTRLSKYHEEIKVRDARTAGREEGRHEVSPPTQIKLFWSQLTPGIPGGRAVDERQSATTTGPVHSRAARESTEPLLALAAGCWGRPSTDIRDSRAAVSAQCRGDAVPRRGSATRAAAVPAAAGARPSRTRVCAASAAGIHAAAWADPTTAYALPASPDRPTARPRTTLRPTTAHHATSLPRERPRPSANSARPPRPRPRPLGTSLSRRAHLAAPRPHRRPTRLLLPDTPWSGRLIPRPRRCRLGAPLPPSSVPHHAAPQHHPISVSSCTHTAESVRGEQTPARP